MKTRERRGPFPERWEAVPECIGALFQDTYRKTQGISGRFGGTCSGPAKISRECLLEIWRVRALWGITRGVGLPTSTQIVLGGHGRLSTQSVLGGSHVISEGSR